MSNLIKFGTDGWRGIIAREFTFDRVVIVTESVRRYILSTEHAKKPMFIGFDTRFLADQFALAAANWLAENGIETILATEPTPTPATAFAVKHLKCAGALMFTASHNPPEYCGVKFIPHFAGPAMPETTEAIISHVTECLHENIAPFTIFPQAVNPKIHRLSIREDYLKALTGLVDMNLISKLSALDIVYNPLFATGIGYLDEILLRAGLKPRVINNTLDPLFGGYMPEPSEYKLNLDFNALADKPDIMLATDGDSDRCGILTKAGKYYGGSENLALLAWNLYSRTTDRRPAARTQATAHIIDRICAHFGVKCIETKVGFKYIGQELLAGAVLGGEESGGISFAEHIPEKDGIFTNLKALEVMATYGSLEDAMATIFASCGESYTNRRDFHLSDENKKKLFAVLTTNLNELFGKQLLEISDIDGRKYIFSPKDWICFRASGTEPVIRVYVEAATVDEMNRLQDSAEKLINNL